MDREVNIDRIHKILSIEVQNYFVPVVDLIQIQTNDPFKVLVTTILSARTNDKTTVNAVKKLFKVVTKPHDFDKLSEEEIIKMIFPVGFYKTKAKHLKALPEKLDEHFKGKIPNEIDDLVKLPGVGRKTANLVKAIAFSEDAICVDTHVHKIMNRFGYIKTKTPFETEMALRKKLPKKYWQTINSILVSFGQNLCRPVSPKCSECPIYRYCNQIGVTSKR